MSIEARVSVKATFPDDEKAKEATSELKKALKKNDHELASALDSLNPIENQSEYASDTINVEDISRKKNVLSIFSYTYTSEEPTWFSRSLYELGAQKIYIRGVWDGHGRNYYYIDGDQVTKKKFEGDKPKKPLSAKDIEINKNLFLPDERATVKAKLISTWSVGDIWESVGFKFETLDGVIFYHQGRGKIMELLWNDKNEDFDKEVTVEFSAAFERGRLEGEYVSFAKRPTKIIIHK
jgi:hypothetical protein